MMCISAPWPNDWAADRQVVGIFDKKALEIGLTPGYNMEDQKPDQVLDHELVSFARVSSNIGNVLPTRRLASTFSYLSVG
jgi:hypothetical protein